MPRLPNSAAIDIMRQWSESGDSAAAAPMFVLGMREAESDVTTNAGEWQEEYDAGREIARAALGLV